jgi:uncharacterized membrane protein required for colicin V production
MLLSNLQTIPDISLGTAALIIVAACALIAAVRGLARLFLGVFLLAAAVLAGFWMWQFGPALARQWIDPPPPWLASLIAVATGVGTFFGLRWILRVLTDPLGRKKAQSDDEKPTTIRRAIGVLVSVVPAAIVLFVIAAVLRHAGSISELRTFAETRAGTASEPVPSFLARLKGSIESSIPSSWFQLVDPLTDEARLALAKWIAIGPHTPPEPVVDPDTGQPVPRAALVEDEELRELARRGRYSEILRDPRIDAALEDPATRRAVLSIKP